MGQYAVALVTINRAAKSGKSICTEVFRPYQFSWTIKGAKRTAKGWQVPTPTDKYAWWLAQKIAAQALSGRMSDFTEGSRFYHATRIRPYWVHYMVPTKRIGGHIFYTASQS